MFDDYNLATYNRFQDEKQKLEDVVRKLKVLKTCVGIGRSKRCENMIFEYIWNNELYYLLMHIVQSD
jgi:hypothetical protein